MRPSIKFKGVGGIDASLGVDSGVDEKILKYYIYASGMLCFELRMQYAISGFFAFQKYTHVTVDIIALFERFVKCLLRSSCNHTFIYSVILLIVVRRHHAQIFSTNSSQHSYGITKRVSIF